MDYPLCGSCPGPDPCARCRELERRERILLRQLGTMDGKGGHRSRYFRERRAQRHALKFPPVTCRAVTARILAELGR